jgi:hypothetical protein
LLGDQWVRVLYLDESGIGKIAREPYLIVSGVLVDGDRQWVPVKEHLRSLLEGAVPSGEPTPSCLHAVDIYHGSGEFPRDRWPQTLRFELLDNIAKIPVRFRLPIVWGLADRAKHATDRPGDTALQHRIDCYAQAAMICFLQVEWYMRNHARSRECASITIEQNTEEPYALASGEINIL